MLIKLSSFVCNSTGSSVFSSSYHCFSEKNIAWEWCLKYVWFLVSLSQVSTFSFEFYILTYFMPLVSFYTPWKHQKRSGFFKHTIAIKSVKVWKLWKNYEEFGKRESVILTFIRVVTTKCRTFLLNRNIPALTELTWDYNYEVGSVPDKELICKCGSKQCKGRLLWASSWFRAWWKCRCNCV